MSTPTRDQMNEAIVVFMGYRIYDWGLTRCVVVNDNKDSIPVSKLDYHANWAALMAVVVKIETIESGRFGVTVDPWSIEIIDYKENEKSITGCSREYEGYADDVKEKNEYLISCYFEAVTNFIKWYNKQKEVNNER